MYTINESELCFPEPSSCSLELITEAAPSIGQQEVSPSDLMIQPILKYLNKYKWVHTVHDPAMPNSPVIGVAAHVGHRIKMRELMEVDPDATSNGFDIYIVFRDHTCLQQEENKTPLFLKPLHGANGWPYLLPHPFHDCNTYHMLKAQARMLGGQTMRVTVPVNVWDCIPQDIKVDVSLIVDYKDTYVRDCFISRQDSWPRYIHGTVACDRMTDSKPCDESCPFLPRHANGQPKARAIKPQGREYITQELYDIPPYMVYMTMGNRHRIAYIYGNCDGKVRATGPAQTLQCYMIQFDKGIPQELLDSYLLRDKSTNAVFVPVLAVDGTLSSVLDSVVPVEV